MPCRDTASSLGIVRPLTMRFTNPAKVPVSCWSTIPPTYSQSCTSSGVGGGRTTGGGGGTVMGDADAPSAEDLADAECAVARAAMFTAAAAGYQQQQQQAAVCGPGRTPRRAERPARAALYLI